MFGFTVLLSFLSAVEIHFLQHIADLIPYNGTCAGVALHVQGPGGVHKLYFEPYTIQALDLPIDTTSHL